MSSNTIQNLPNNNDEYYLRSREYFRKTVIKDAISENIDMYTISNYLDELIYHIYDTVDNNNIKDDIKWLYNEILQAGKTFDRDINERHFEMSKDTIKLNKNINNNINVKKC
jgi:hypothetical protein